MKRLLLLSALAVGIFASASNAQVTRRVLVEEFTNTGCPPCAATDPMVESFEFENLSKVTAIKWHVSWPDATDPFYKVQSPKTLSDTRGQSYYGVTGVPFISLDGAPVNGQGNFSVADKQSFIDYVNDELTKETPYDINIVQSTTADSIIADITIKCMGEPKTGDLRLGVAFAERYNPFHGTNGRPFYTSIVRSIPSGLGSDGGVKTSTGFPAFTIAKNETKTYRYAAKIGSTWTVNQLMTVVFIQDADSKEIHNSNWTLPAVKIEAPAKNLLTIPSDAALNYKITNPANSPVTLKATFTATGVPADWNVAVTGLAGDGTITIPANGTATVSLNSTAASNKNGYKPFSMTFTKTDDFYIGGIEGQGWGKDNQHIIVDGGAGTAKCNTVATAITTARSDFMNKTVVIPRADFEGMFDDWKSFKTVIYNSGAQVGLYSDVGSWEKLAPYLAGGGHFLLSSSVAVSAYYSSGDDNLLQLWRDNFRVEPSTYDNTTGWSNLIGMSTDPIGDGINTTIAGMTTTQELSPFDASGIPAFQNENGGTVGLHYENATHGKSVLLTFDIDAVKTADRPAVALKIMNWFDGIASVKTSNNAASFTASNYPNPAVNSTKFTYSLTDRAPVSLVVRDVMGREVATVVSNEAQDMGTYEADMDCSKLASGTYFYTLTAGNQTVTNVLNVVK
jgi:thiol-disulfide isomerase/thioredoxin